VDAFAQAMIPCTEPGGAVAADLEVVLTDPRKGVDLVAAEIADHLRAEIALPDVVGEALRCAVVEVGVLDNGTDEAALVGRRELPAAGGLFPAPEFAAPSGVGADPPTRRPVRGCGDSVGSRGTSFGPT
jgi:hypothetical protein